MPVTTLITSSSFHSISFSRYSFLCTIEITCTYCVLIIAHNSSKIKCCSHFGTLFLVFGFLFPFRHDFFLQTTDKFQHHADNLLSEIIFLALVQINGKVLIDFRNLFTEISAARMNYKKICSVR